VTTLRFSGRSLDTIVYERQRMVISGEAHVDKTTAAMLILDWERQTEGAVAIVGSLELENRTDHELVCGPYGCDHCPTVTRKTHAILFYAFRGVADAHRDVVLRFGVDRQAVVVPIAQDITVAQDS
jgi:hypothetical protein